MLYRLATCAVVVSRLRYHAGVTQEMAFLLEPPQG